MPTISPPSIELINDVLRTDAQLLALKYKGSIDRAIKDPEVRITKCEQVADYDMNLCALDYGYRNVREVDTKGMCIFKRDGTFEILIRTWLLSWEVHDVKLHEVGHARAGALLKDSSERAADYWAEAWHQAAVRVQLDRLERG